MTRFSRLVKIGSGLISNKSGLIIFPPPTVVGKVFNCYVRGVFGNSLNCGNWLQSDSAGVVRAISSLIASNLNVGQTDNADGVPRVVVDLTGLVMNENITINVDTAVGLFVADGRFGYETFFEFHNGKSRPFALIVSHTHGDGAATGMPEYGCLVVNSPHLFFSTTIPI